MHWFRQLFNRTPLAIPEHLWQQSIVRLPFLARLSHDDLDRLRTLCEALLARKPFTGAGGFLLDDDIAVMIAVQASLPVLNLTLDLYDDMAAVLVYPAAFLLPQAEMDEDGVVHEWREPVSGEAIDAGGAVVLSWEDAVDAGTPGYNLVIHEFAHKIDMRDGAANGCPPFLPALHSEIDPAHWQRAFEGAYEDFLGRVERLEARLPDDFDHNAPAHAALYDALCVQLPLDPYAARHPAEFFAVASEAFFVLPQPLALTYPEIFRLLTLYYRQNPIQT